MAGSLTIFSLSLVLLASLYELLLKDAIFISFGVGRVIQPIEDFPYSCRRIRDKHLEACEDLWLDDEDRVLYAACTGTDHRIAWNPAMAHFNAAGRRPGGAEVIAINIDNAKSDDTFDFKAIKLVGYIGAAGDTSMDTVGFDAEIVDEETIHFSIVNQRPTIDDNGKYLNPSRMALVGSNATVEVFEFKKGGTTMEHLRTIWAPETLTAPNNIATVGHGAFYATNDHGAKVGLRHKLEFLIGGGDVQYCVASGECHKASPTLKFPNGLARGKEGRIYVPGSVDGRIRVFEPKLDNQLEQVDTIHTTMPLDNLAVDANGDIYAAGFPHLRRLFNVIDDPYVHEAPATILRIKKISDGYKVEKAVEDREGKIISMATTARHDVKTGRIFIGSAVSPFLVVCDPK